MNFFISGDIHWVSDRVLTLPPEQDRDVVHNQRPVIIVSKFAAESNWKTALIIPCSTSPKHKSRLCVPLAKGIANLSDDTWARVPALQVIAKDKILSKIGSLPAEDYNLVMSRLWGYLHMPVQ